MISVQQQKVIDLNQITTKVDDNGMHLFIVRGYCPFQKASYTQEGALKKGIGYVMSKRN